MIDDDLRQYIEETVLPLYSKNEPGHGIWHIRYVIERCFELCDGYDLDVNMLFTAATYHDIGHHIDYRNHETVSAKMMYEDENLKKFFNEKQRVIIKEAIEDHRASLKNEPRSVYGKLVSSADRNIFVDEALKRTYYYCVEHFGLQDENEIIEESWRHLSEKFGEKGYAKFFVKDDKYEKYLKEMRLLLGNKEKYIARQKKIIAQIKTAD